MMTNDGSKNVQENRSREGERVNTRIVNITWPYDKIPIYLIVDDGAPYTIWTIGSSRMNAMFLVSRMHLPGVL